MNENIAPLNIGEKTTAKMLTWWALLVVTLLSTNAVFSCDEFSQDEVESQFKACKSKIDIANSLSCANVAEYLECGTILDLCTQSSDLSESITIDHLKEDLNLVTDEDLTDILKMECNEQEDAANVRRPKRSPKRGGGGSRGGSRSSSSSRGSSSSSRGRVSSGVKTAVKKVKQVLSGGGSKRPKPISSFGGSSSVPKPKKKSKLKKFGKYAVAGLAAYGTYKLAKKMSKGIRRAYDDDDCWDWNPFQRGYECQCRSEQCRVYVGSAPGAVSAKATTVTAATLFVIMIGNRVNL